MKPPVLIFDTETFALPLGQLTALMPEFEANKTFKDPEKIAADLAKKREAFIRDAALDARTGQVLVVGFRYGETVKLVETGTEAEIIHESLTVIGEHIASGGVVSGFCVKNFDLPFLLRRAWVHGQSVSPFILRYRRGRVDWSENIADLKEVWAAGDRGHTGGLNDVCRALGLGEKSGSGADFGRLWDTDRDAARAYLKRDLTLTASLYERLLGWDWMP